MGIARRFLPTDQKRNKLNKIYLHLEKIKFSLKKKESLECTAQAFWLQMCKNSPPETAVPIVSQPTPVPAHLCFYVCGIGRHENEINKPISNNLDTEL